MELFIKPSKETFSSAKALIKLMDESNNGTTAPPNTAPMVSKLAKNIKQIKSPVPRYFEHAGQLNSYYSEAEYDLVSVYKLYKAESYFLKAVQKKVGLLCKSGYSIRSEDEEITKYMDGRFKMMFMQTGVSLESLVKQIAFHLTVCSNAFLIKSRDPNCEFAEEYSIDGKAQHPVVGLFVAHPTAMKPRFRVEQDKGPGPTKFRYVLWKWVHTNRRGQFRLFDPEDVVHFRVLHEEGMVFGMPEVVPVIDDIRTLRKIEEDIQLLLYRDLFPIIHYTVETPTVIDHGSGLTELDQAKHDIERIVQDGGIATDSRHKIEYVGNKGNGIDAAPYLTYFQGRVFTGLGVAPVDMGIGTQISGETGNSMSKQVVDAVKFIQHEIINQFNEKILVELGLQSPFGAQIFEQGKMPVLHFEEIDLEWQIRKENHHADLFTKGVKTVDEARHTMGHEPLSEEEIKRTQHGLYEKDMEEKKLAHTIDLDHKKLEQKASVDAEKLTIQRQAKKDSVKKTGSNSNITKSARRKHKDSIEESIDIQDVFKLALEDIDTKSNTQRKLDIVITAKCVYDAIKNNMVESMRDGMEAAAKDLGIDSYNTDIEHDIFGALNRIRDNVVELVYNDSKSVNRAAARIATANKTEQTRAYNYGYGLVCVNNMHQDFIVYSDFEDVAADSTEFLGKEITLNKTNIVGAVPPFRPNSRLKIKVKDTKAS